MARCFGTNTNPELKAATDYGLVGFFWQQYSIQPQDA
jgi:hypothetical protein